MRYSYRVRPVSADGAPGTVDALPRRSRGSWSGGWSRRTPVQGTHGVIGIAFRDEMMAHRCSEQ